MTTKNRAVYIHQMDICCSAGLNKKEVFDSILQGVSGVSKYKNYLIDGTLSAIGKIKSEKSFDELLFESVKSVIETSVLDVQNTFLLVGSSVGGMAWAEREFIKDYGSYQNIKLHKQAIYSISYALKKHFGFKEAISFSTACTSSSNAIVFAKELIESGSYDTVLVVGVDSISYTTVNGFNALGVLSSECAVPFDEGRAGMNVAEGIGTILFSCKKSDIELCGVGCSSDAYNITHPQPEGLGAKLAMTNALEDADIKACEIDYINAHGTATLANDLSEARAILDLFSDKPLVGSTKSITGHTLGACGAIELIISALVLKHQIVPANFNLKNQEIKELNLPKESAKRELKYVLSNSFAFGGNNVSIVIKRVDNDS